VTLAMAVSIAASVPRILMVRMLSLLTRPSRTFAAGVGLVDQSVLLLVMGAKKRFTTLIESDFGDIRRSGLAASVTPPQFRRHRRRRVPGIPNRVPKGRGACPEPSRHLHYSGSARAHLQGLIDPSLHRRALYTHASVAAPRAQAVGSNDIHRKPCELGGRI
jgi:hypothetical protein